jgi:hypothetical protein
VRQRHDRSSNESVDHMTYMAMYGPSELKLEMD